ncbi:MAG: hypothetical protein Q7U57_09650 [Methylovulum sp.]|nr:hypothetical protein [Methylovulum sp.]
MNLDQLLTDIDRITDEFEGGAANKKRTRQIILNLVIDCCKQAALKNKGGLPPLQCGDIDDFARWQAFMTTQDKRDVYERIDQVCDLRDRFREKRIETAYLDKLIESGIDSYEQRFGVWVPF